MVAGRIIAVLILLHIGINFRYLLSIKTFFSFSKIVKFQYIVMCLMLISMTISVVTGAIWGNLGQDTTIFVRAIHSLFSWLAFLLAGTHVGLNLNKLISYFS